MSAARSSRKAPISSRESSRPPPQRRYACLGRRKLRPRCSLATAWAGKIGRSSLNKTNQTNQTNLAPPEVVRLLTSPSEYGSSGPCLRMAWADTDNPVLSIEINLVVARGVARARAAPLRGGVAARRRPFRGKRSQLLPVRRGFACPLAHEALVHAPAPAALLEQQVVCHRVQREPKRSFEGSVRV